MSNEQTPSVGRVVHYVSAGSPAHEHLAATIARVNTDGTVNLGVLSAQGAAFPRTAVPYDAGASAGTWHWPERV